MGRDDQPKHRQKRKLERKINIRAPYDRILIVSEGTKTEPHYFREIRSEYRLQTANVEVQPSEWGTDPLNIVKYAEHLFSNGDINKKSERELSTTCMQSLIEMPTRLISTLFSMPSQKTENFVTTQVNT